MRLLLTLLLLNGLPVRADPVVPEVESARAPLRAHPGGFDRVDVLRESGKPGSVPGFDRQLRIVPPAEQYCAGNRPGEKCTVELIYQGIPEHRKVVAPK